LSASLAEFCEDAFDVAVDGLVIRETGEGVAELGAAIGLSIRS
jgi:hypothetical protein